jgi:uncharacterized membrane protein
MKPLIVLLAVFGVSTVATFIAGHAPDYYFCGRLAMGVMLLFAATAHFKYNRGMMLMVPTFIPYKKAVVYITGYIEVLAAIGLLVKTVRDPVAWFVIIFFVLLLPANIHSARKKVNLERADNLGSGLRSLWFRIPLQLFFMAWVYYFGVMH